MSSGELFSTIATELLTPSQLDRFKSLVLEALSKRHEYRYEDLLADPRLQGLRPSVVAIAIGELIKAGTVEQVFRVMSPRTHGGIGDFSKLSEVPSKLHDWRTDLEVDTGDNIDVVYKF